ncbi:31014_t:CDS:1, partial [Racocetra persica]
QNETENTTKNEADASTKNQADASTKNQVDKVDNETKNKTEDVTNIKPEDVTNINPGDATLSEANKEKEKEYFTKVSMYLKGYSNAYNPWKPKYLPDKFEDLLQQSFGKTMLKDTVNDVKVIIPAYNITSDKITFFTNLYDEHKDYLMKDVIRAMCDVPL